MDSPPVNAFTDLLHRDLVRVLDEPGGRQVRATVITGTGACFLTQGELHDRVSRVACLALNSKGHTEFYLGLAWIGAVAVPLDMRLGPKDPRFIVEDSGAKAIFTHGQLVELAQSAISAIPEVGLKILDAGPRDGRRPYGDLVRDEVPQFDPDGTVTGDPLFMLLYTSGTAGEPKACRIMQQEGPLPRARKRFKCRTVSEHDQAVAANDPDRNLDADRPNQKWVGDTTELVTGNGGLFLAVVLDLNSRHVVGWAPSPVNDWFPSVAALRKAIQRRCPGTDLLHHSVQGSTYAAEDHQAFSAPSGSPAA